MKYYIALTIICAGLLIFLVMTSPIDRRYQVVDSSNIEQQVKDLLTKYYETGVMCGAVAAHDGVEPLEACRELRKRVCDKVI